MVLKKLCMKSKTFVIFELLSNKTNPSFYTYKIRKIPGAQKTVGDTNIKMLN